MRNKENNFPIRTLIWRPGPVIDTLNSDVENLKIEVNRLEQYGCRSSLRFNNMNVDPNLNEIQLTTYMKNFINSNILKGPAAGELTESDIDRCRPVGGFRGKRKPQVIVKFLSYKVKARVYGNKKNHPDKTFITEDLTKANHSTVKTLLKFKKNDKIDSFWTIDGKVLVKTSPTSKPLTISSADAAAKKFNTQFEEINDDESQRSKCHRCIFLECYKLICTNLYAHVCLSCLLTPFIQMAHR